MGLHPYYDCPYEVQGIAYHTISTLEEVITWGQTPFAPWFVQLLGGTPQDQQR
jgi:isopentenyldiphosphate isomerase